MKKTLLLALFLISAPAFAQQGAVTPARVVTACGGQTLTVGQVAYLTVLANGSLCTTASVSVGSLAIDQSVPGTTNGVYIVGGSTGNGAASNTGAAVPTQGDYQALNVGGTLRGQTGTNPSGSIYAADVVTNGGTITTVGAVTAITNALPSGTNVIGHVIADSGSTTAVTQATGTNLHTVVDSGTITTVSAVTAISNALPAGTNVIGHVIADSGSTTAVTQATGTNLHTVVDSGTITTVSTVTAVSSVNAVVPGTGATNLGKAEDSVAASGDTGVAMLGVIQATLTAPAADGDYTVPKLNANGAAWVQSVFIDAAEGAAVATNPVPVGCVYRSSPGTLDTGDVGYPLCNTDGRFSIDVGKINGVTPLMGAGNTGTGSLRVTVASDQASIPVAATLTAETTKVIGTARILGNGGATLDSTVGAGTAPTNQQVVGALYNSTEISPSTGQAFALQADSKGRLRNVLMDAAGNTRGANVNASNQLSTFADIATVGGSAYALGAAASTAAAPVLQSYNTLVSGAVTSAMTGTTSTSTVGGTASNYLYITECTVSNASTTVSTDILLQDGSGGTTLWVIPAPAASVATTGGGGAHVSFPVPLKVPTSGNALYAQNVTTGSSTKISCGGFRSTVSY